MRNKCTFLLVFYFLVPLLIQAQDIEWDLEIIASENAEELVELTILNCAIDANTDYLPRIMDTAWSPTSNLLAATTTGAVCLYELSNPTQPFHIIETADVFFCTFNANGTILATIHNGNRSLQFWDVQTGNPIETLMTAPYIDNSLVFTPDGRYIVSAGGDGLRLRNAETQELLIRADVGSDVAGGISLNQEGTRLVAYGASGIEIWTIHPGELMTQDIIIPLGFQGLAFTAPPAFSGFDDNLVAYFDWDRDAVVVWNIETQETVLLLDVDAQRLAFSPQSSLLAIGLASDVMLWDYEAGISLWTGLTTQGDTFNRIGYGAIAFNSDGTMLAIGGAAGDVTVWGVPHGDR